jgi:hypothetical protein
MISVGSGNSGFREPNQLHADKQANVISTKTLNLYAHSSLPRHERITQRHSLCTDQSSWATRSLAPLRTPALEAAPVAEILRNCIARQFERPLKSLLQGPRAEERAAMILTLIAGFILMRKVIGIKALTDVDGSLSREVKLMFQRLIDSSASGVSPRQ